MSEKVIYEVARFVGAPAEQIERFLGALKACGYGITELGKPAEGAIRPLSEVTVPLMQVIQEPCKGCGKRPVDFINGDAPPAGQTEGALTEHLLALKDDVFAKHTAAVSEFLNELYAIMVDPCAEGTMTVTDMKAAIIKAALRDRDVAAQNAAKDEGRELLKACLEQLNGWQIVGEMLATKNPVTAALIPRISAHLAAQPVAAEGFAMVPIRPTPEMLVAGANVNEPCFAGDLLGRWNAMLTARPKRAEGKEGE